MIRQEHPTAQIYASQVKALVPLIFRLRYFILVLMCLVYLGVTNNMATQGYILSDLQKQLEVGKTRSTDLELQVASFQTLPRLESEANALALTPLSGADYLITAGSSVAIR